MVYRLIYISSILFFVFLSCGNSKKVNNSGGTEDVLVDSDAMQNIDFEIILQDAHSGFVDKAERIIKSQEELAQIYKNINLLRDPDLIVPEIDFKKEMVVALFMGEQTSGGFSTKVTSINSSDDKLIISIKEKRPGPTDFVTNVICQPICLAKVPLTDQEVVFKKI